MASDASALVSEKRARSEGELVQRPRPKKKVWKTWKIKTYRTT